MNDNTKLDHNLKLKLLEAFIFASPEPVNLSLLKQFDDNDDEQKYEYYEKTKYGLELFRDDVQIKKFIDNCKFYQNAKGFITKEFFYNLLILIGNRTSNT